MFITTSSNSNVKAKIRFCPEIDLVNPFKLKRWFFGLHLDFSTHQMILYLGVFHLFIEILEVDRSIWGYATIDNFRVIKKHNSWTFGKHCTNHIPDDFFNIGITADLGHFGGGYSRDIIFFFGKYQLNKKLRNQS